ncbi:methylated-DNA--[protein]-cysteine S-methyltransferase [Vibrio mexicanus]|uniref:methylated-DNA--[protein]-cysteine S-methyltransferase n=1 Tax=Vibrio mexicanus TaxID=1004326 RepID=UPI00063CE380|nr:methylated-DNA--[protein]-cysteine S-methyltransferase [Vibrio mexicanus]
MKYYSIIPSELGEITIQASDKGVTGIWFETFTTKPEELGTRKDDHHVLVEASNQLNAYFAKERQKFDLPLDLKGTEFQKQVWQALTRIPYGETWSYKELAELINRPQAVRAVGTANGKNPISIVVPCHRVIGANGKLTGYAGGVERKEVLLRLEKGK